jgi:hypothetical protein
MEGFVNLAEIIVKHVLTKNGAHPVGMTPFSF